MMQLQTIVLNRCPRSQPLWCISHFYHYHQQQLATCDMKRQILEIVEWVTQERGLSRGFSSRGQSNKHVFSVCLDKLISQAVSQSVGATSPSTPSPWHTLPDIPLEYSTILVLSGALLAIGGSGSSAIHFYQPSNSSWTWVKVGDLPKERSHNVLAWFSPVEKYL